MLKITTDFRKFKKFRSFRFSYVNHAEVRKVHEIVFDLLQRKCANRCITEEDIGIIAPYRSQVHALKDIPLKNVFIGTTESFQGTEKPIIIISTVRSGGNDIGFLKDFRVSRTICLRINLFFSFRAELFI